MAPERVYDPSVPSPWCALEDSGVRYYWNPETQLTQYEHPMQTSNQNSMASNMGQSFQPSTQQPSTNYGGYNQGQQQSGSRAQPAQPTQPNGGVVPCASIDEFRKKNNMEIRGQCPDPFLTFEAAGFPRDIMNEIHRAGFKYPTPIQSQAWPIAMAGRDMVGIAKTGSGKTCGFLIPGLLHIRNVNNDPRRGPTLLCLAPTRELAVQIKEESDKFGNGAGIRNTCVYGGAPRFPQIRDLRYGVQIVIATPGRLNDFIESGNVNLDQVSYLVLDEADRMLDMGFEPQIQSIVNRLPAQRQTLFFSATWPREVQSIARQFVKNDPVYVFIDHSEDQLVANKSIKQFVDVIDNFQKLDRLRMVLKSKPPGTKTLIFCTTKRGCDELSRALAREFGAAAIHGDKKQPERDYVLRNFKLGRNPILVATDVAARGLDIPGVSMVVNFDFPNGVEDYVHRIGRTGRAGASGESHTFFTRDDGKYAHELIDVLKTSEQIVPPQLLELAAQFAPQKSSRWSAYRGPASRGRGRFSSNRDSGRSWRPQNDRFSSGNRFQRYSQAHGRSRSPSNSGRFQLETGEFRRDTSVERGTLERGNAIISEKRCERQSQFV